jgi:hypothetical protein
VLSETLAREIVRIVYSSDQQSKKTMDKEEMNMNTDILHYNKQHVSTLNKIELTATTTTTNVTSSTLSTSTKGLTGDSAPCPSLMALELVSGSKYFHHPQSTANNDTFNIDTSSGKEIGDNTMNNEQQASSATPPSAAPTVTLTQHNAANTDLEPIVYAKALYDFTPNTKDEIVLEEEDILTVTITEPRNGGWLFGINNGYKGWFPQNYVQILTEEEAETEGLPLFYSNHNLVGLKETLTSGNSSSLKGSSINLEASSSLVPSGRSSETHEQAPLHNHDREVSIEGEGECEGEEEDKEDDDANENTENVASLTAGISPSAGTLSAVPAALLKKLSIGKHEREDSEATSNSGDTLDDHQSVSGSSVDTPSNVSLSSMSTSVSTSVSTAATAVVQTSTTKSPGNSGSGGWFGKYKIKSKKATAALSEDKIGGSLPSLSSSGRSDSTDVQSERGGNGDPSSAGGSINQLSSDIVSSASSITTSSRSRMGSSSKVSGAALERKGSRSLRGKAGGGSGSIAELLRGSGGNNKTPIAILGSPAETKLRWVNFVGGTEAVEKLDISKNEKQRQEVIYEIICTERDYVEDLETIIEIYIKPLKKNKLLRPKDMSVIFSNIEGLLPVNTVSA